MEHIKMDLCQGFDGLLPKGAIVEPLNLIHDDSRWYYVMHWKLRPDSTWSIATNDKKTDKWRQRLQIRATAGGDGYLCIR